jgi:pyrroline-5-carboxylate reductase
MRIAFIGGGNMATALIGSLVADGSSESDFVVVEPLDAQRARLAERFPGIELHANVASAPLGNVTLVVLAVKPQQMREACTALKASVDDVRAVLSIAAGTRIRDISRWLGGYARIIRAMPNTPSLIGAGITGVHAPPTVDVVGRDAADTVLAAAGEVVWCNDEAMLDAVTGVSASGPAYVFYCLEALEQAAKDLGFAPGDARKLAYATFDGAVKLAHASDVDPQTLRAQVTSKGGTTERGIAALEQAGVKEAIIRAAKAATARATELGDEFGSDGAPPGSAA